MAEQIRVVVFKDGNAYIAQCLEIDVAAQGKTADEALARLKFTFTHELKEAEAEGRNLKDIGPAPEAYQMMYNTDVIEKTTLAA